MRLLAVALALTAGFAAAQAARAESYAPSESQGVVATSSADPLAALQGNFVSYGDQSPGDQSLSASAEQCVDWPEGCVTGGDGYVDPQAQVTPGWFASVDYLYWKPRQRGMDFAVSDLIIGDGAVRGPVRALEQDSNSGVRASVGGLFSSGWDLAFTYTYYDTDDRSVVTPGPFGLLLPTHFEPSLGLFGLSLADARSRLNFHDFCVDAGYWICPSDVVSLRLFGGLRGATVWQRFSVLYDPLADAPDLLEQSSQVDAFGVRLGSEIHWYIRDNVSLFARGAGSVLVGDVHANYRQTIGNTVAVDTDVDHDYFDTIPVMEVAAGVNVHRNQVTIQAGYELATWFNLGLNVAADNYAGPVRNSDLGLDGFFVRLIWGY